MRGITSSGVHAQLLGDRVIGAGAQGQAGLRGLDEAAVGIVEQMQFVRRVHACSFSSTKYSLIFGML